MRRENELPYNAIIRSFIVYFKPPLTTFCDNSAGGGGHSQRVREWNGATAIDYVLAEAGYVGVLIKKIGRIQ